MLVFFVQKKAVKREIGVLRSNHTVPATVSERVFFWREDLQIPLGSNAWEGQILVSLVRIPASTGGICERGDSQI